MYNLESYTSHCTAIWIPSGGCRCIQYVLLFVPEMPCHLSTDNMIQLIHKKAPKVVRMTKIIKHASEIAHRQ